MAVSQARGFLTRKSKALALRSGFFVGKANIYNRNGILRDSEREMLTCPKCKMILQEPVQLISCGCRFCKNCLEDLITESCDSNGLMCPTDGEKFTETDVRNDRGCRKEIASLEVDCPTEPSCDWRGPITIVKDHVDHNCPNVIVQCDAGCGEAFPRCEKETHAVQCTKRKEKCRYCSETLTFDEIQDHIASCPEYPISCDYCSEKLQARKELSEHLNRKCTEYHMDCPFKELTHCDYCDKKVKMTQHVATTHLIDLLDRVSLLTKEVGVVKSENKKLRSELKRRDDIITEFDKRLKEVEHSKESWGQRYYPDFVESDSGAIGRKSTKHKAVTDGGIIDPSSSATIGKLREDLEASQSQISHLNTSMQTIQAGFAQFGVLVDEVRLRQDVLDVKTTSGTFIWKIPDIRRRYGDAIERRTLSLYSPPFYTSPHGYRMCIRTYLNGDGVGKGSHISLFFVLMKSEHDSLLVWPFKQAVRFTLINQLNRANDITEAFAPDLSSPSFQRPQGDMNVASGFPRFAKQSVLQDESFTKDNVIFIKAQVDLSGLNLD